MLHRILLRRVLLLWIWLWVLLRILRRHRLHAGRGLRTGFRTGVRRRCILLNGGLIGREIGRRRGRSLVGRLILRDRFPLRCLRLLRRIVRQRIGASPGVRLLILLNVVCRALRKSNLRQPTSYTQQAK